MSFRKRNLAILQPESTIGHDVATKKALPTGVRPSPVDGHPSTSTGTRSLDALLAGHAGLVLGTSLLLGESGTTDFAGVLLRFYAAEGQVQGHQLHVLGAQESWARELPGIADNSSATQGEKRGPNDRMKIAWRYESLEDLSSSGREKRDPYKGSASPTDPESQFCHDFDLRKRLALPSAPQIHFIRLSSEPDLDMLKERRPKSPFTAIISHLTTELLATPTSKIHRVVIPSLLSPALYPPNASEPENLLQFLHALRGLLRRYPQQLSVLITFPLALYPRSTGLTRWMEMMSDGVLELAPFPATSLASRTLAGNSNGQEEPPQGLLKIHRLPIFHEIGGGSGTASHSDDMVFTLSRRHGLVFKPFSLPPLEDDPRVVEKAPRTDRKLNLEF